MIRLEFFHGGGIVFVFGRFQFRLEGSNARSREGAALPKQLGDAFTGVINCDRAKMYWQAPQLQWCWAHLIRDLQALIDREDKQLQRHVRDLMRPAETDVPTLKALSSRRIQSGDMSRLHAPVRQELKTLLLCGVFFGTRRLVGMCNELHKHRRWSWNFVDRQGLEPTNNTAERAWRPRSRLPQTKFRHAKRIGQSVRRTHVDGRRNMPPATTIRLRPPHPGNGGSLLKAIPAVPLAQPVNGCQWSP